MSTRQERHGAGRKLRCLATSGRVSRQPRAAASLPGPPGIRLGAAAGEVDFVGLGAHHGRHLAPCQVNSLLAGPACEAAMRRNSSSGREGSGRTQDRQRHVFLSGASGGIRCMAGNYQMQDLPTAQAQPAGSTATCPGTLTVGVGRRGVAKSSQVGPHGINHLREHRRGGCTRRRVQQQAVQV